MISTEQLVEALLCEHTVLRMALYRLETLRYFIARDTLAFLESATAEAESALHALVVAEVARQSALEELADALGMPVEECTMRRLAVSNDPNAPLFAELHVAFQQMTSDLLRTAAAIRATAGDRGEAIGRVVRMVFGAQNGAGVYSPGESVSAPPARIDWAV
jgi:hypothetical protein